VGPMTQNNEPNTDPTRFRPWLKNVSESWPPPRIRKPFGQLKNSHFRVRKLLKSSQDWNSIRDMTPTKTYAGGAMIFLTRVFVKCILAPGVQAASRPRTGLSPPDRSTIFRFH